ncbi:MULTISPECIES: tRNA dihydrouridine synthase [Anaerostipes]|uniref:tRNA dihydrouridine synthase n=1 Tax=Anaerostipes TaxID=207244 RepID=UPI001C1DD3E3|nr:tRNA-dihydrouridine synthase family protein [Anaerostipes sp.]MCI5623956.1 tRNA-dihydrouridine synthase family protein [Anaerostipes sp.]MDY2726893.1 tRNA-dihydrouridine synthase family protein [Anaerostipes faecalis]
MKFYFAPMEGITIFLYRNAYEEFFGEIDKYFTPFIMPNGKRIFKTRELNDVLPENNEGIHLVPQILTRKSEEFIKTARELKVMGYEEVNLNLGCPSKTVVSKGKGSGFLKEPEDLDVFLSEIFDSLDMKISIKTRIGLNGPEEFEELLEIYNRYPLEELIIHPRIQKEYYQGKPHLDIFERAWKDSVNSVCYNGDIVTVEDYETITQRFPKIDKVMIGRGLLHNPALIHQIKYKQELQKQDLKMLHDRIYEAYQGYVSGDKNVLFKMKDFWSNPVKLFKNHEKHAKKIRKAQKLKDYENAVKALFEEDFISDEG